MRRWAVLLLCLAACGDDDGTQADGPFSPCGLPVSGSTCKTGTVLERCDGGNRVEVDCAEDGKLCGADPQNPGAAACVTWGGSCGQIGSGGVCAGDVLTRCSGGSELRVIDCGGRGADCAFRTSSQRYECTDACREMGTDAEGECTSGLDGIHHCVYRDGAFSVETTPCPEDTFCRGNGPETRAPTCMPLCGVVSATGRCVDDVLTRCDRSTVNTTNCADIGRVCAWSDVDGYQCALPGAAGTYVVRGQVRYEDRAVSDGLLAPATLKPVRAASVSLIDDAEGRVIATVATTDLGDYTIRHNTSFGRRLRILAVAASPLPARPVRVLRPDGLIHAASSAPFTAAAENDVDVVATERSGTGEAFNILDVLVAGQDMVRAAFGIAEPLPVEAVWGIDSSNGTYTQDRTMFLLGGLDFRRNVYDDDGYDDAVMAHEFGHTIERGYGATNATGGTHSPFVPVPPTLAWSEGFADWTSSAIRSDPVYTDTNGLGGFFFEIDQTVTPANPGQPVTQNLSENTVAEMLWDLSDHPDPDDDPVMGDVGSVLRVEPNYFAAQHTDRGAIGIDLVDFLDGYLFLGGAGECAGTQAVVGSRMFPYDFAGPVTCP